MPSSSASAVRTSLEGCVCCSNTAESTTVCSCCRRLRTKGTSPAGLFDLGVVDASETKSAESTEEDSMEEQESTEPVRATGMVLRVEMEVRGEGRWASYGDAKPNRQAGRREPRLHDASTRPNNAPRE